MVSIKNLTYSINDKALLDNISLTFSNNEIIGITGGANSGKSLLMDILRLKIKKFQGNIEINDCNIKDIDKKNLNKLISYYSFRHELINQEAVINDWILGGRIHHKKRLNPFSEIDREIAYDVMEQFGLADFAETKIKHISESLMRIVSIAKTFASQANILLLENPEAGLNLNQSVLLGKNIKKYTTSGDNIIILTSTSLNFIAATCDRIIVLSHNSIAETGSHRIITDEFVKKYFKVESIVTKNIYTGLPEIQVIEEN
ncbi:MAG: ATP-binding cassette domain-containing protein [Leptospirales bacterium]|nr:ATP-binding cassette domain-containing protein [Leptospirales bacterium]